MEDEKVIPVVVAVRCRPLVKKEISENSKKAVEFPNGTQIFLTDVNKSFTFDHVFSTNSTQDEIYENCGKKLISNLFKGYNATILAYGQTGSGKTYTMGTAYSLRVSNDNEKGIIPRVVADIFELVEQSDSHLFDIKVSFLEVYNENIFDLFSINNKEVTIREDLCGIKVAGIKEMPVKCEQDVLKLLEQGTCNRKTGQTNMNDQSSRSHALFTLSLVQTNKMDSEDCSTAKFHLVDLAGSERAKKTGATGDRFKEGININKGLLALGNVISSLCDGNKHVPYRDSKLTRLLQDSLGGNSYTVMVACVSPADSNLEETLNTLRYADRARKIKNRPIVNKDPRVREIEGLKKMVTKFKTMFEVHMTKCPMKDDLSLMKDDLAAMKDVNTPVNEESKNSQLKGLKEEIDDDLNLSAYDTLSIPKFDSDDDTINNEKPASKKLRYQLLKSEEQRMKLQEELKRCMLQISGFCGRMICAESARDQVKTQLKTFVEITENSLKEITNVENFDIANIIQQKLAPIINESMIVINQSTPNPRQLWKEARNEALPNTEIELEISVAISKELQNIEETLSTKQTLLNRLLDTKDEMASVTADDMANVALLAAEIKKLENERDQEVSAPIVTKNPTAKVSEERRKKIKQLEDKISKLQKDLYEKTKLLEMKKEQESRMNSLEKEIKELKKTRVSLMRKMEGESKRMAELTRKIKCQDAKYQNEQMKAKMLLNKNKEENAHLLRKLKAAQAAKQKLEASLQKQNALARNKILSQRTGSASLMERIRDWLNQEIDVEVNRLEARKHVELLKENRAQLAEELHLYEEQLEELSITPKKKRISGENSANMKEEETSEQLMKKLEIEQEISRIKHSIGEFTSSIKGIHQDMLKEPDDLAMNDKTRWKELSRAQEYKCALSYLFDMVVNQSSEITELKRSYSDAQHSCEQVTDELKASQKQNEKDEENYAWKLNELSDKYNSKITFLLEQLSGIKKETKVDDINFESGSMISQLKDSLQQKSDEVEHLQTQLILAKTKKSQKATEVNLKYEECSDYDGSENDSDEENDEDPDWSKTPMPKRFRRTTLHVRRKGTSSFNDSTEKYSPNEFTCSCKGSCKTRHCGCRKFGKTCNDTCKCGTGCLNMDTSTNNSNSMNSDGSDTVLNRTLMGGVLKENSKRSKSILNTTVYMKPPTLDVTRPLNSSFFSPLS